MGKYSSESILTSEKAYMVLRAIVEKESEGAYATEIAENYEMDRSMVSEIIGRLEEVGLVEKGKRTKAQYYKLDKEGIFSVFDKIVREDIIADDEMAEDILKSKIRLADNMTVYDVEEALDRDLLAFLHLYFEHYIQSIEMSTIRDLYDIFLDGIEMLDLSREEVPDWLYAVRAIAKQRHDFTRDPETLLNFVVLEYKKLRDTIEKKHNFLLRKEKGQLEPLETETTNCCPECQNDFSSSEYIETNEGYECPECGAEFESPSSYSSYYCPNCESQIESPEHETESSCGCGVILNESKMYQSDPEES